MDLRTCPNIWRHLWKVWTKTMQTCATINIIKYIVEEPSQATLRLTSHTLLMQGTTPGTTHLQDVVPNLSSGQWLHASSHSGSRTLGQRKIPPYVYCTSITPCSLSICNFLPEHGSSQEWLPRFHLIFVILWVAVDNIQQSTLVVAVETGGEGVAEG